MPGSLFVQKYSQLIKEAFPDINIIMGTHQPTDQDRFLKGVKELRCQTISLSQTMNYLIKGVIRVPEYFPMTKDNDEKTKPKADEAAANERPNANIKPPQYMIITEGFDPSKLDKIIKEAIETKK